MTHVSVCRLMPGLLLVALAACGRPDSPAEVMAAADAARSSGDPQAALDLYERLLDGTGEDAALPRDRFKAELSAVGCLIELDRAASGVARYRELFAAYPAEMGRPKAYVHTITVLQALEKKRAKEELLTDMLELAREKHPEQGENFSLLVEDLIAQGSLDETSEAIRKLREIDYLSGSRRKARRSRTTETADPAAEDQETGDTDR